MRPTKSLLGLTMCLFGIVSCNWIDTCYLNSNICEKDVKYHGKPIIELYKKDGDEDKGFRLIELPDRKKGFYIDAKEEGNILYTAYQVYQNDYTCPVNPFIEPARVNYKIEIYKLELERKEKLKISALSGNIPTSLKAWANSLKVDKNKILVCEDGLISYSSWFD